MSIYVRKRSGLGSNPLFTIGITFILGLAIGASLVYAVFPSWKSAETPPPTAESEAPPSAPAQAEPSVAPPPPAATSVEPTVLAGLAPARHLFIAVPGETLDPAYAEFLQQVKPGGVVLRKGNVESANQVKRLVGQLKQAVSGNNEPQALPLIAANSEQLIGPLALDSVPTPQALADAGDTHAARQAGMELARALAAPGIRVVFGPSLAQPSADASADLLRFAFGSDSQTVQALGLAFADGLMAEGVIPVVKPYPGLRTESNQPVPTLNQDIESLVRIMLPFFEAARLGIPGLVIGSVAVPALDEKYPTRPAELSPVLVRNVLRDRRGFTGVIIADDLAADPIAKRFALEDAAVEALTAGCDAVVLTETEPARILAVCNAIARAVQEGVLPRAQLDESKRRLDGWGEWLKSPQPLAGPLPELGPLRTEVAQAPMPEAPALQPEPEAVVETPAPDVEPDAAPPVEEAAAPETEPAEEPATPEVEPETALAVEKSAAPATEKSAAAAKPVVPEGSKAITYEIKEGDRLFRIAREFGVSTQDIMKWNNLPDENIKWGKRLTIYVPADAPEAPTPAEEAPEQPAPATTETVEPAAEPEAVEPVPADVPEVPEAEPAPELVEEAPIEALASETIEIQYEVQRGDMLNRLASRFGVTPADVMKWNRLSNPNLKFGQKLKLHVSPEVAAKEGFAGGPSVPVKPASEPEPEPVAAPAPAPAEEPVPTLEPAAPQPAPQAASQPSGNGEMQTYVVAPGDTATRIAKRFNITVDELLRLNGLDNPDRVLLGQKLKVPATP